MKKLAYYILCTALCAIIFTSCKKDPDLPVPPVIPTLEKVGVYQRDGVSLFDVTLRMQKTNTYYLFENQEDPYQGKMVSVSMEGVPAVNETKTVTIGVQNIDITSGQVTVKVERVTDKYIQLASDKYRFVIPKK